MDKLRAYAELIKYNAKRKRVVSRQYLVFASEDRMEVFIHLILRVGAKGYGGTKRLVANRVARQRMIGALGRPRSKYGRRISICKPDMLPGTFSGCLGSVQVSEPGEENYIEDL